MKLFHEFFRLFHFLISLPLVVCALGLLVFATLQLWQAFGVAGVRPSPEGSRVHMGLRSPV